MTINEILSASGLTMAEVSRRFAIPYRTLQDWSAGKRTPPEYVLQLLAEAVKNSTA